MTMVELYFFILMIVFLYQSNCCKIENSPPNIEKCKNSYQTMSKTEDCLLVLAQGSSSNPHHDDGLLVAPVKPALKSPSLYQVIMLNDDYTPMDFVIEVLLTYFSMNEEKATQIMLTVHTQGQAVCGVFTRDIAETKMALVNQYSAECDHPLLCEIKQV